MFCQPVLMSFNSLPWSCGGIILNWADYLRAPQVLAVITSTYCLCHMTILLRLCVAVAAGVLVFWGRLMFLRARPGTRQRCCLGFPATRPVSAGVLFSL